MNDRIKLTTQVPFVIPAAIPAAIPDPSVVGVVEIGDPWQNIHILLEEATLWTNAIVAAEIELYGWTDLDNGQYSTPFLIAAFTVTSDRKVDVPVTIEPMGSRFMYLRQVSGTACKATIAYESKHSGQSKNPVF